MGKPPKCSDYVAYTSLYAVGTVQHKGIAAIIIKSPYMRRLQALSYFSDLKEVLQTNYEQHVIGTSEIMKNYPLSITKIKFDIYRKFLLSILAANKKEESRTSEASDIDLDGNKSQDRSYKVIDNIIEHIYYGYSRRLSEVASIPSLMGMLATPPLRRPLGTTMKRKFMRVMNNILFTNKNNIINILKEIKENYIKLYKSVLFKEDNSNRNVCRFKLIEPLNTLFSMINFSIIKLDNSLSLEKEVTNSYCEQLIEFINKFYKKRVTPQETIREEMEKIEEYVENTEINELTEILPRYLPMYYISSTFLLRFRNLSNIIGIGFAMSVILSRLEKIIKEVGTVKSKENRNNELEEYLNDMWDNLLKITESLLINSTMTIYHPRELVKLKVKIRKGDEEAEENIILPALLGVPYILYREGSVISDREIIEISYVDEQRYLLGSEIVILLERDKDGFVNVKIYKKNGNSNTYVLEEKYSEVLEYIRSEHLEDVIYEESYIPCCILTSLGNPNYYIFKEYNINELIDLILHLLVILNINNLNRKINILKSFNVKYNKTINMFKIGNIMPFLSHFKVNLIQSDMLPSAYQLDLLHRLDKDINIGIRIDYENFNDIVFNLDIFNLLSYMMLSSIYMYLFADTATLSARVEFLTKASAEIGIKFDDKKEIKTTIQDLLGFLYLLSLRDTYLIISEKLEFYINHIKKDKSYENYKNIKDIIKVGENIKDLINSYIELFDKLLDSILSLPETTSYNNNYNMYATLEGLVNNSKCKDKNKIKLSCVFLHVLTNGIMDNAGSYIIDFEKLRSYKNIFECKTCSSDNVFLSLTDMLAVKLIDLLYNNKFEKLKILVHGKVPLSQIFFSSSFLREKYLNYYNYLMYTLSNNMQMIYSPNIQDIIKFVKQDSIIDYLELDKFIVQIPVQGVMKFYFHLPESVVVMPRVVEAIHPTLIYEVNPGLVEVMDKKHDFNYIYGDFLEEYLNLIGQFPNKSNIVISQKATQYTPIMPDVRAVILPDLELWDNLGPTTITSEITKKIPRHLYRNINIIYAAILSPKDAENKIKVNSRMLQEKILDLVVKFGEMILY